MMLSKVFSAHPVLDHALPNLSDYGFFAKPIKDHVPINKVLPYKIASPLFSDYSEKLRFIQVPVNETITHDEENKLFFPVGTFLIKTFYYLNDARESKGERRLIETRLLKKTSSDWVAIPYICLLYTSPSPRD